MMLRFCFLFLFTFSLSPAVYAQNNQQAMVDSRASTSGEAIAGSRLGMVTGSETGTYYRIGQDIAEIVSPKGLEIDVKTSSGSIDNIGRIGSRENAAIGIVQSDVLGFLKRSNAAESRRMAENLRMVFPLYKEEVHLVANKDIKTFQQLNGKTVSVGRTGSGSWLTAMNLFALAGITPEKILRVSPEEGLVAVLRGRADAMLFVSGKPVKLFENLTKLQDHNEYDALLKNVHFVPLENPAFLNEYDEAQITPRDYRFVEETVPTLAVTALLVSYNFAEQENEYAEARCNDMQQLASAMHEKIDVLKQTAHPKWQEVNLDTEVLYWERDPCVIQDTINVKLESELLGILRGQ